MSTTPDVLTAAEAAQFLRTRPETLKRLARQGKVPGTKLGHEWRFLRQDLVGFLGGPLGGQADQAPVHAGRALAPVEGRVALPADLRERIMGFVRPRNWDGEGAQGITRATCREAVELAEEVHAAVRGLPWPLAGVVRWGAILLTWQVEDQAVSVYLPRVRAGTYCYQWEGPGFLCGEEEGSRNDLIGAVAKLQPR